MANIFLLLILLKKEIDFSFFFFLLVLMVLIFFSALMSASEVAFFSLNDKHLSHIRKNNQPSDTGYLNCWKNPKNSWQRF